MEHIATVEVKDPSCKNCRWGKEGKLPTRYDGERGGTSFGLEVRQGLWQGFTVGEHHYDSLGVFYCEHLERPRGLVLTNYVCRDHELAPEYDQDNPLKTIEGAKLIDG